MTFEYIFSAMEVMDPPSPLDAKWMTSLAVAFRTSDDPILLRAMIEKVPDSCPWALILVTVYVVCYLDHGIVLSEREENFFGVVESVLFFYAGRQPHDFEEYTPIENVHEAVFSISAEGSLFIETVILRMFAAPGYWHIRKFRPSSYSKRLHRIQNVVEGTQVVGSGEVLEDSWCGVPGCRENPCRYDLCKHVSCHRIGQCTYTNISTDDPHIKLWAGHAPPASNWYHPRRGYERPPHLYGSAMVEDGLPFDLGSTRPSSGTMGSCRHVGTDNDSCYICQYDDMRGWTRPIPIAASAGGQSTRWFAAPTPPNVRVTPASELGERGVREMTRHRAIEILAFHGVNANPNARWASQTFTIRVAFGECRAGRFCSTCHDDTYVLSGQRRPGERERLRVEEELLRVGRCIVNGQAPFRNRGWSIVGSTRCGCGCGQ